MKPAKHVHHSTPHRGNPALFWDRTRWVGLCQTHHNADAQQIERRGYASRVDASGLPTDPNHPFNRATPVEIAAARPQGRGESKVSASRGSGPVGEFETELVRPTEGSR
ncbi:hypothetical protein [Aureimonas phyllosphaerae]|uniref:HNH endonuclease n=1 Tax=Aureimonas phyllosphaerae TaxID=1166078 RepID=A0A7W6BQ88_9HYPH|nr:hypothetical protein [Aureimonas phyllosphaerae]MBB3934280.1 hypothetical protein [Aureimonas phyllosphaerae]MBB3958504.1 hypothetical protein [Aureimonas phyllosphaerae]